MIDVEKPSRKEVGLRLAIIRTEKNLSRHQVEWGSGVGHNTLIRIEDGNHYPQIPILMRLCNYYGVTPNDILGYSDASSKAESKPVVTADPPSVDEMAGRLKRARLDADPPSVDEVAGRLKRARLAAGLTQKAAADAANIGKSTVYTIEHGRTYPTLEVLMRLCSVYRVNIADIVYKEET